ncbi:hypothetical protein E2C01_021750 [Portunus trituberculatus]|uniref:Uncharacterized protein n=1 Tax=Portunus trituberculatus TaxID=210409 RepID=A0A5B7E3E6_PORTR|nr:hypothetical protein [Portunus trituberculatus]
MSQPAGGVTHWPQEHEASVGDASSRLPPPPPPPPPPSQAAAAYSSTAVVNDTINNLHHQHNSSRQSCTTNSPLGILAFPAAPTPTPPPGQEHQVFTTTCTRHKFLPSHTRREALLPPNTGDMRRLFLLSLLSLAAILLTHITNAQKGGGKVKVLTLNRDGAQRGNTLAEYGEPIAVRGDYTLCLRFNIIVFRLLTAVIYILDQKDYDELPISLDVYFEKIRTKYGGYGRFYPLPNNLATNKWYFYCQTRNSSGGEGRVYLDGELLVQETIAFATDEAVRDTIMGQDEYMFSMARARERVHLPRFQYVSLPELCQSVNRGRMTVPLPSLRYHDSVQLCRGLRGYFDVPATMAAVYESKKFFEDMMGAARKKRGKMEEGIVKRAKEGVRQFAPGPISEEKRGEEYLKGLVGRVTNLLLLCPLRHQASVVEGAVGGPKDFSLRGDCSGGTAQLLRKATSSVTDEVHRVKVNDRLPILVVGDSMVKNTRKHMTMTGEMAC